MQAESMDELPASVQAEHVERFEEIVHGNRRNGNEIELQNQSNPRARRHFERGLAPRSGLRGQLYAAAPNKLGDGGIAGWRLSVQIDGSQRVPKPQTQPRNQRREYGDAAERLIDRNFRR